MAARKLQTEIDRTLKKVSEGVELFESIHEKLMASTNATQKDKLETDLKTQIKKLQRLRDQIKTWLTSNDVKDKTLLLDNRKLIETQMERFKALEKEMKTKAFSKEGLIAATRLDPIEKAKVEARQSLEEFVDTLSRQIEQAEAEIEVIQASSTGGRGKKGGKSSSAGNAEGRISELERLNDRRNWHISKLEAVMRLLENGKLSTEQVSDLKEDVSYFVESNQEEDFEEDEGIYEELHLDQEDDAYGMSNEHDDGLSESDLQSAHEDTRTPAKPTTHTSQHAVDDASHPSSPVAAKKTPMRKSTAESKTPIRSISGGAASTSSPASRQPAPPPLPTIKYATAAAAAVAQGASNPQGSHMGAAGSTTAGLTGGSVLSSSPTTSPAAEVISPQSPPATVADPSAKPVVESQPTQPVASAQVPADDLKAAEHHADEPTQNTSHVSEAPHSASPYFNPRPAEQRTTDRRVEQDDNISDSSITIPQHAPDALSDLIHHFESAKRRSGDRLSDINALHATLDNGLSTAPEPRDSERPSYYHPRTPYVTPPYYPQQPHPALDKKDLYSTMDLDTLFFIFYYRTNTYEQWCAARELKRQSWRYHKQYLTWFQRLSQPQAITDEYEQGMYVYFDWENGWATRKKSDFRFEYYYLSED